MKNKVMVISAHPDDETLGVGGTLLKHKFNGDELYWIIGTKMIDKEKYTIEKINSRKNEIKRVSESYGISKTFKLNYETTTLNSSSLSTLIPQISEIFNLVKPNIIYTLHNKDAHSDHRIISNATLACTKSFRYPYIKKVLMYECLSETELSPQLSENIFIPNYFVDITDFIEHKIKIMKIYESELGSHPFPRSIDGIKALSTFRGLMVNMKYAEAFQVIKIIE